MPPAVSELDEARSQGVPRVEWAGFIRPIQIQIWLFAGRAQHSKDDACSYVAWEEETKICLLCFIDYLNFFHISSLDPRKYDIYIITLC